MDSIEMLKEFAKFKGIDVKEVDEFLKQWGNPKTLDDVINLPHDLQNHVGYISWLEEPLYSFVKNEMWCDRHEVITVDSITDILYDRIYNLLDEDNDNDLDIDDVGIFNLKSDDNDKQKKLEEFQKIAQYIIDSKFGSVTYDW